MDLKGGNEKLLRYSNIDYNKHFKIRTKSKDYYNNGINKISSQNNLYLNNKMNNLYNSRNNYIKYSSINNEDINYIPPPSLKDKILSPGDDDILPPKYPLGMHDNYQEDDICIYNIKNIYNNKNKLLILDLDETLVHTSFQPLGKDINNRIIEPDIFLKIFFDKKYYDLYVLTRPYIYEFLKEMSKLFVVYIFTASIREYADPLLNELDKDKIIKKRLFRDSCTISDKGKYVKNLNNLNYNLKDIILLDNNPISYSFNKTNGIPIKTWHNDKNDKELLKIRNFLNFLSSVDDVRYYIPKVIENDEIIYYKINIMLTQQLNIRNNKEDINYFKKPKNTRNYSHFNNNSVNNVTPHKKINFNKDENLYINAYTKTDGNENNNYNNGCPINYREPKSINYYSEKNKNILSKIIKEKNLSILGKSRIINNNIKININSINFNLDYSKSVKKKKNNKNVMIDDKNVKSENSLYFPEKYIKRNKNDNKNNDNSLFNNLSMNKPIKKKNYFHKPRLSANNLTIHNKLNKNDNNKDFNINYFNINTTNNKSNNYSCFSYSKKQKSNQINDDSKKKNRIILVKNDYYNLNLNLNLYENNNKNINEKINKIKVNKNKNIVRDKYKNLKANINNGNIKRNDTFKGSKTFYDNKEDDIIKKQKYLSKKEPIKLKILKKEKINKPEIMSNNNDNMNIVNRISSEHYNSFINKDENFYKKRRKGLVKERSCTEFIGGSLNFYKNFINGKENFNFNDYLDSNKQKKSFDNEHKFNNRKNNYEYDYINNNKINIFNGLKAI